MTDIEASGQNEKLPENSEREHASNDANELGSVRINTEVIARIARGAALKVPGVVDVRDSLAARIASFFGRTSQKSGIRINMDEQCISIGMNIIIAHGVRIPDVVWQIQNDVRQGVEGITGKTVKTVDVVVQDVKTPSNNISEGSA